VILWKLMPLLPTGDICFQKTIDCLTGACHSFLKHWDLILFKKIVLLPEDKKEIILPLLEDLVIEALLNRPEMKLQDRKYEIERDQVKIAITNFLPVVSAIGSFEHNTDSFLKYSSQWVGGATGVMSLFNGFANINKYKAAREKEKLSYVEREEACLMVMLQVQQAFQNVQSAEEIRVVAEKIVDAKKEKLREEKCPLQRRADTCF